MMTVTQLLEKYRSINIDYDWWEFAYETFREDMKEVGIDVQDIYFSGFCSQGDGACFEGDIVDTTLFLNKHFKPTEYPMLRKLLYNGGDISFRVRHKGHYYHSNSTDFHMDIDGFIHTLNAPTDLHTQILEVWDTLLDTEAEDFRTEAVGIFRTYMDALYKQLGEEHDYLTSDKAVWETIVVNKLYEEKA